MTIHAPEEGAALPWARAINSLRDAVRALARDGPSGAPDEPLRAAARLLCDDARARGIRVEALLVSLKQAWPVVTEGEPIARAESSRLLARLVTLCVQEYYGPLG
jgi:hypothetical protein